MDCRVVRIGTRGSALARAQTLAVAEALGRVQPEVQCELVLITTGGDRSQPSNRPGPDWGSGIFVKELEVALLRGAIDLAVHSLKDVPPVGDPRLALAAFPSREDPLDVLVTRHGLTAAPPAPPDRRPQDVPVRPERRPLDKPAAAAMLSPAVPGAAVAGPLAARALPDSPSQNVPEAPGDQLAHVLEVPNGQPQNVPETPEGRVLDVLATGARVGTSSARRAAFLGAVRPDLVWLPIRGNVETRLRKLGDGQYDAVVLARAGLLRLGLDVPYLVLGPALLPPAPGQGALAIQTRADDAELQALVAPLDDAATHAAVRAERHFMALLEGGCRLPVGALAARAADGTLTLLGGYAGEDGQVRIDQARGSLAAPEALAVSLARQLRQAAPRVLPV